MAPSPSVIKVICSHALHHPMGKTCGSTNPRVEASIAIQRFLSHRRKRVAASYLTVRLSQIFETLRVSLT